MSTPNDGGPAFGSSDAIRGIHHLGMTLRDYFAAKALGAMGCLTLDQSNCRSPQAQFDQCARNAYIYADAMLAERSKQTP